jgi:hypothetical protein
MRRANGLASAAPEFLLTVRLGLGLEFDKLAGDILNTHLQERELLSISTAKQGTALEFIYLTRLRPHGSADELVRALNRVEGMQSVLFQQRGFDLD